MTRPKKAFSRRLVVTSQCGRQIYVCTCERCGAYVNGWETDNHAAHHAQLDRIEEALRRQPAH